MATYQLISSVTVGSGGAATIEFTSIPQTYTDLCLKFSTRGVGSYDVIQTSIYFNSNTSSIYSQRNLQGYNGAPYSASTSPQGNFILQYSQAALSTASSFGSGEMYIPNYTSTTTNKSVSWDTVAENNSTSGYMLALTAGLFASTNAITSISLATNGVGNWAQYSTAYLYGISNA